MTGCDNRAESGPAGSGAESTDIHLYFQRRYRDPSLSLSSDDWAANVLPRILDATGVRLMLHPVEDWYVSDSPGKRYDVFLDEDALRDRMDGVLFNNPYDGEPESFDLAFHDLGAFQLDSYIDAGLIMPVEYLLKSHAPNLWSSYPASYWEAQRYRGEIWGIPAFGGGWFDVMPPFWIIRNDVLADAGLTVPGSFEELVQRAIDLKARDDEATPIVFTGRFDVLEYMLAIHGYRSLMSNLLFYDDDRNEVYTILDEPFGVLERSVELLEKMREAGIYKPQGSSRIIRGRDGDLRSLADSADWFAFYHDFSASQDDLNRVLSLFSEYSQDADVSVLYFAPQDQPWFLQNRMQRNFVYYISARTEVSVEIAEFCDFMSTREGYEILFPSDLDGYIDGNGVFVSRPSSTHMGYGDAKWLYAAFTSLNSNPIYLPVLETIYCDTLRDYYNLFASHQLVEYGWENLSLYELDWENVSEERQLIDERGGSSMREYFRGETTDLSWIDSLVDAKPLFETARLKFQDMISTGTD